MKTPIERFTAARACAEHAPEGTYNATKELLAATGAAMTPLSAPPEGLACAPATRAAPMPPRPRCTRG